VKIAMLSPYSLSRPGGVQGQVLGLARALRGLGHQVTVVGPDEPGENEPAEPGGEFDRVRGVEEIEGADQPGVFVMGGPTGLRSNGSVAPVTVSPIAAMRAERFVRHGAFDVLHVHEPLAPVAAYGFVLHASVPMVGTYHRAGVSRWVPLLKPLVYLVGSRLQVRVAVSEAARDTAMRSSKGEYEVLYNGVDMERFARAEPTPSDLPTVLFLGRHETRKGLSVLLDAFALLERPAVLWVAGDGPQSEVQRRRHPESDRVKWLGTLNESEVAARLLGADVVCAPSLRGESFGMVVLEGMAARCAVVASDLQGYRSAAGGHAVLVPPGDVGALSRALGVALADVVEGSGRSSPDALKAAESHANGWSMESLAEHYVDAYRRAIDIFARKRS
jgi:phosphatidyl-myo-inositol alpha-mannosyltransferase